MYSMSDFAYDATVALLIRWRLVCMYARLRITLFSADITCNLLKSFTRQLVNSQSGFAEIDVLTNFTLQPPAAVHLQILL